MAVIINHKICDNSPACGGIEACPCGVFSYNKKKKRLEIDNSKCISCGKCEASCPIGAIGVAKTKEEYEEFKKIIDNDPRKPEDLFVERYGADIIDKKILVTDKKIQELIRNKKSALIEFFNDDSIACLLKSIPVKIIKDKSKIDVYLKCFADDKIIKKYKIKELPSLLVIKQGKTKLINGYFEDYQKEQLFKQL